jgi:hypothetical protein
MAESWLAKSVPSGENIGCTSSIKAKSIRLAWQLSGGVHGNICRSWPAAQRKRNMALRGIVA